MKHKTDHTHNQSSSLYLDTLFCCYMNFDNMISNIIRAAFCFHGIMVLLMLKLIWNSTNLMDVYKYFLLKKIHSLKELTTERLEIRPVFLIITAYKLFVYNGSFLHLRLLQSSTCTQVFLSIQTLFPASESMFWGLCFMLVSLHWQGRGRSQIHAQVKVRVSLRSEGYFPPDRKCSICII